MSRWFEKGLFPYWGILIPVGLGLGLKVKFPYWGVLLLSHTN